MINVKKLKSKTAFNGDTAYITQLKQQKSKKCWVRHIPSCSK